MALILEKTLDSGVTAEYWRIICVTRNQEYDSTHVDLYGYHNKTMRLAGKDQLHATSVRIEGNIDIEQPIVAQAYTHLKTLPEWEGAVDDI